MAGNPRGRASIGHRSSISSLPEYAYSLAGGQAPSRTPGTRGMSDGLGPGRAETVTVMFTDMVGSTELSARLGPEPAEALRQTHSQQLRKAVSEHAGRGVKDVGD